MELPAGSPEFHSRPTTLNNIGDGRDSRNESFLGRPAARGSKNFGKRPAGGSGAHVFVWPASTWNPRVPLSPDDPHQRRRRHPPPGTGGIQSLNRWHPDQDEIVSLSCHCTLLSQSLFCQERLFVSNGFSSTRHCSAHARASQVFRHGLCHNAINRVCFYPPTLTTTHNYVPTKPLLACQLRAPHFS